MVVLSTVLASLLLIPQGNATEQLNQAFIKTPAQFQDAWNIGESDARKSKRPDLLSRMNSLRRDIGSIRTSGLGKHKTVSWVWCLAPEFYSYSEAYQAVAQYKSPQEMAPTRAIALPTSPIHFQDLGFYGFITLMPSFAGGHGRINRYANPNDLSDVRVVLKVGDRILQPIKQPGNMLQTKETALNSFAIPRYTYSTTTSSASGSAYGSGGYAYGSATGTSSTVSSYVEHNEQAYNWYQGQFSVDFKLLDSAGKPLITASDTEIELIVIYGNNERHAKFMLKDLERPLE